MQTKYRKMKVKLTVTVVLPLFIILLALKAAQTFIQIKVRDIFAKPAVSPEAVSEPVPQPKPAAKPVPTPVSFQTVEKAFIRPVPADHRNKEQFPV